MISYKPLWKMLAERNINTYKLEKDYGLNKAIIHRLKHNHNITLNTLDQLCQLFDCKVEDIIQYEKDNNK